MNLFKILNRFPNQQSRIDHGLADLAFGDFEDTTKPLRRNRHLWRSWPFTTVQFILSSSSHDFLR